VAQRSGVIFHGLFLETGLGNRIARIGERRGDASDADEAVARRQEQYELDGLTWTRIDASGTPAQTLERARIALGLPSTPR
jgi:predicted kinase